MARLIACGLVFLAALLGTAIAAPRPQVSVPTPAGPIVLDSVGGCARPTCPAVLILSGSKGFDAPAYDVIGQALAEAGLDAYLVHVLTPADLSAIAAGSGARARIAYYRTRWSNWIAAIHSVTTYLAGPPPHARKIGLLGVSLGAQIASAAAVGQANIAALVLVDGGFPDGYSTPVRSLPPLHLIWGGADQTIPPQIGRDLLARAQQLGGPVSLDVYDGAAHAFFLHPESQQARDALRSAAAFLAAHLSPGDAH